MASPRAMPETKRPRWRSSTGFRSPSGRLPSSRWLPTASPTAPEPAPRATGIAALSDHDPGSPQAPPTAFSCQPPSVRFPVSSLTRKPSESTARSSHLKSFTFESPSVREATGLSGPAGWSTPSFNPRPAREATRPSRAITTKSARFNPRPRTGGDRRGPAAAPLSNLHRGVSIHASAREATRRSISSLSATTFQSTPPHGRRP